jgi:hypothetical protein
VRKEGRKTPRRKKPNGATHLVSTGDGGMEGSETEGRTGVRIYPFPCSAERSRTTVTRQHT